MFTSRSLAGLNPNSFPSERNCAAAVSAIPRGSAEMVAAVRTIFAQPDAEHVREQMFGPRASGALPMQRNKDRGG